MYSASALDEIIPILNSYVQITENFRQIEQLREGLKRLQDSNARSEQESASPSETTTKSREYVKNPMSTFHRSTNRHSRIKHGRINNSETGYKSMEKSLKAYKVIGNVSIGIAIGSLIVTGFVLLPIST